VQFNKLLLQRNALIKQLFTLSSLLEISVKWRGADKSSKNIVFFFFFLVEI